ncbi:creatininase family protein [Niallia sp. 01092]|uniref:creatininase family protein n=1 Tax=unclassified Niallia TaxID=2837522 RepID=UPI003FD47772
MLHNRYSGHAFEKRFLPRLSTKEVEVLEKEDVVVVLPVGAIEQHGPHLPIYTDTLIGEGLLVQALEMLPEEENIWVLPPLAYGKSTEHLGMPGTITLSASTLQAVITDIAKSVQQSGFKKLLLFNTHGGNHDLLNMISRDIRIETGLTVFRLNPDYSVIDSLISEKEQKFGIHAGEVETSMILALKESWVNMDLSPTEFVHLPEDTKHLYLKGSSYFAWVMNDISNTGVAGDAASATIEKGRKINALVSQQVASALKEMIRFNISTVKSTLQLF